MNRRAVLKNLTLIIGGAVLLPSCLSDKGEIAIRLKHVDITADQEKLVANICETIIPKTNTPGARDLNLPAFVLKMLDDCYKKKDQQAFIAGLGEFNNLVEKKYNRSFGDLDSKDREAVLIALDKSSKAANDPQKGIKPVSDSQKSLDIPKETKHLPPLNFFYSVIKQQTIFGYTNSQYFMTKQVVYELVPGRYNPHFPVKNVV